ncbi:SpoIIE family protein phosphatase [Methylotetracoccus oryzae]|uniref:SpoIIE family protein phosphatase n=1 Tax=Methylotetracoccus oryzae TaxID=1919059 RepID=UPI0013A54E45|nr:SpoIIE family protein phosphatase [Methylotetracoccus oryzae]
MPHAFRTLALKAGEPCGDRCAIWLRPSGILLAIIDGLGHGPEAARAAAVAERTIAGHLDFALRGLFQELDRNLQPLRGAALGVARIADGVLTYCGVGNPRAWLLRDGRTIHLPADYGVVGAGLPAELSVHAIGLEDRDWIILASDGVSERVQIETILPEWGRNPEKFCDYILHYWRDPRDDAAVLVYRFDAGEAGA